MATIIEFPERPQGEAVSNAPHAPRGAGAAEIVLLPRVNVRQLREIWAMMQRDGEPASKAAAGKRQPS